MSSRYCRDSSQFATYTIGDLLRESSMQRFNTKPASGERKLIVDYPVSGTCREDEWTPLGSFNHETGLSALQCPLRVHSNFPIRSSQFVFNVMSYPWCRETRS